MSEEDFNVKDMEDKKPEARKQPQVDFFVHENDMMHKDMDIQRSHRTTFVVCATFIVITCIFVFAYTFRMNSFLDTINKMTAALVEMANAKGFPTP